MTFTDKEHKKHCKIAGCKHPAVYPFGQGWCALCRAVAFAPVPGDFDDGAPTDPYGAGAYGEGPFGGKR